MFTSLPCLTVFVCFIGAFFGHPVHNSKAMMWLGYHPCTINDRQNVCHKKVCKGLIQMIGSRGKLDTCFALLNQFCCTPQKRTSTSSHMRTYYLAKCPKISEQNRCSRKILLKSVLEEHELCPIIFPQARFAEISPQAWKSAKGGFVHSWQSWKDLSFWKMKSPLK